jgi:hypothetical protein
LSGGFGRSGARLAIEPTKHVRHSHQDAFSNAARGEVAAGDMLANGIDAKAGLYGDLVDAQRNLVFHLIDSFRRRLLASAFNQRYESEKRVSVFAPSACALDSSKTSAHYQSLTQCDFVLAVYPHCDVFLAHASPSRHDHAS